jgi:hypothetical protein
VRRNGALHENEKERTSLSIIFGVDKVIKAYNKGNKKKRGTAAVVVEEG